MAYRNTLQADALKLVGKKLQSSLAVEGELPEDGLDAYGDDDDGDDLMLALTRKISSASAATYWAWANADTWRNGYRPRRWDTRAGSIELQIPKLRQGSYFPALLEPRRRAERALLAVVQQAYVEGVSTRRVDDLVRSLGCEGISKSQVSRICAELDDVVASFLERPLDGGPYRYLWLDALTQRVREEGRIAQVSPAGYPRVRGWGGRHRRQCLRQA